MNRKLDENQKTNKNFKNIEKNLNKRIKLATRDRLIGKITEGILINKTWFTLAKLV